MFTKKDQLKYRKKSTVEKVEPESHLQKRVDSILKFYHLKNIRIHSSFWRWVWFHCPVKIKKLFTEYFTGMPDNIMFLPLDDNFSLCLQVELKTKIGKQNAAQKKWAKEISVVICRDDKEFQEILKKYFDLQKKIRGILK